MTFDINTLVSLLFLAGGGGAVASILTVVKTFRSGKIETEETLIRRMDADNKKQQVLREAAEKHAEEAEKEAAGYRKERNEAWEQLARTRRYMIENGLEPPKFGDDDGRRSQAETE